MTPQKLDLTGGPSEIQAQLREIYLKNCATCHGKQGQGKVGPNLTDAFWIAGDGSKASIEEIITNGRPRKGMPGWKPVLSSAALQALSQWTFDLRKHPVLNGKAPQGKKYGE